MRIATIKLILLPLILVPNNNHGLNEIKKHTCHLKTIQ
jgi:hypothetical protein